MHMQSHARARTHTHTQTHSQFTRRSTQFFAVQSLVLACYTLLLNPVAMLQAYHAYNPSVCLFCPSRSPAVYHMIVQAEYQGVPTGMLCQLVLASTYEDDYQYLQGNEIITLNTAGHALYTYTTTHPVCHQGYQTGQQSWLISLQEVEQSQMIA